MKTYTNVARLQSKGCKATYARVKLDACSLSYQRLENDAIVQASGAARNSDQSIASTYDLRYELKSTSGIPEPGADA